MKPIGTITKYFRFIDSDTRSIIESIMASAYDYWGFVTELCRRASSKDSSDNLLFLAALHAANVRHIEGLELLWENHPNHALVSVFIARLSVLFRGSSSGHSLQQEDIDRIFSMPLDDWMAFQTYYELCNYGGFVDFGLPFVDKALRSIKDLFQNNPLLDCYEPEFLLACGIEHHHEGNHMRSFEYCQSAYASAVQIDDQLVAADALHDMYWIKDVDIVKAREVQSKAKAIYERLGNRTRVAEMVNVQGLIYFLCGEFNAAIDSYLECIHLRERAGLTSGVLAANIAWAYNEMECYGDAFEWGQMALATLETLPILFPNAYRVTATALVGLHRFDEALECLEKGRKIELAWGGQIFDTWEHVILGLIERAEGNISESILSFERALHAAETSGVQTFVNSCSLRLAESEVEAYSLEKDEPTSKDSESYVSRLEVRARERGYLGVLGLALLLKARLRIKQEETDDAARLIREVQGLAQQSGLRFLEDRIVKLSDILEL